MSIEEKIDQLIWIGEDNTIIPTSQFASSLIISKASSPYSLIQKPYAIDYLSTLGEPFLKDELKDLLVHQPSLDLVLMETPDSVWKYRNHKRIDAAIRGHFEIVSHANRLTKSKLEIVFLEKFESLYPIAAKLDVKWKKKKWQPNLVIGEVKNGFDPELFLRKGGDIAIVNRENYAVIRNSLIDFYYGGKKNKKIIDLCVKRSLRVVNQLKTQKQQSHTQTAGASFFRYENSTESIVAHDPNATLPLKLSTYSKVLVVGETWMHRLVERYIESDFIDQEKEALGNIDTYDFVITFSRRDFERTLPHAPKQVVLCAQGPFSMIKPLIDDQSFLWSADTSTMVTDVMIQCLFGALSAKGKMPITAIESVKPALMTKGFTYLPVEEKQRSRLMIRIDSVLGQSIKERDTPGVRLFCSINRNVVLNESYGFLTYDSLHAVSEKTLFDLASLTKVLVTTLLMMKADEEGVIDLDRNLGDYLPELIGTDKEYIRLEKILLHESQLHSYVGLWRLLLEDRQLLDTAWKEGYYHISDSVYAHPLSRNLWVKGLVESRLRTNLYESRYLYSDLGFMFLQLVLERVYNRSLDELYKDKISAPLGLRRIFYNPLSYATKSQIAPTSFDEYLRDEMLWGWVHDRNAAMAGGVAGHAGLFGTAKDVARIGQMVLNEGDFNGQKLLQRNIVRYYTDYRNGSSRRGYGWDKPDLDKGKENVSIYSSPHTFGHSGFTGTCLWVDPEYNLVFVFLSNRIHPDENNRQLIEKNVRSRILDIIYEELLIDTN